MKKFMVTFRVNNFGMYEEIHGESAQAVVDKLRETFKGSWDFDIFNVHELVLREDWK